MNEKLKDILEAYTDFDWEEEISLKKFNNFYYIGRDKNETILNIFKDAEDGRLIYDAQEVNKKIDEIDQKNELSIFNDTDKICRDLELNGVPYARLVANFIKNLNIDKNGKVNHPSFKNQKFGRVVSNFIKGMAVADNNMTDEQLNAFLRKYVQGTWAEKNYLKEDEVLVLSINPIDFLTCSNGVSWTSCMNYANGEYKSTIFNYLTMKSAIIAFIAKKDDLLTKICRSWVYIDETGVAVQHEYPNHDSLLLPYGVMGVLEQKPLPDNEYKITYKNAKDEGYVDLVKFGRAISLSSSQRMVVDLDSTNLCLECLNETKNNDICCDCGDICHGCGCSVSRNMDDYFIDNDGDAWCDCCYHNGEIVWSDNLESFIKEYEAVWSDYHGTYLLESDATYIRGDYYLDEEVFCCDCCDNCIAPDEEHYHTETDKTVCEDCTVFIDDEVYSEDDEGAEIDWCRKCHEWFKIEDIKDGLCEDCRDEEEE